MSESSFQGKFDDFRGEVIDRLARIETLHGRIIERLDRMNGTMDDHGDALEEHEKKLARMRGAAGILAALVAAAVSVLLGRIRFWLAP
jgi:hypothetical protein